MRIRTITILCVLIIILSTFSSLVGIFSDQPGDSTYFFSIYGSKIEIYNKGIYKMNSKSVATQGIASDLVTLIIAIPLLSISLYKHIRRNLKWTLLLIGFLGYFLYTYISYVFLWFYNPLFLVYVAIMSLSLFAIVGILYSFDYKNFEKSLNKNKKVGFYAFVQIIVGIFIGLMWINTIVSSLISNSVPNILEHYTSLVIQALDLGIVIPLSFYSGYKLFRMSISGYFLTPILLTKGMTLLLSIFFMTINMHLNNVTINVSIIFTMLLFCIFFILSLFNYMKNIINI